MHVLFSPLLFPGDAEATAAPVHSPHAQKSKVSLFPDDHAEELHPFPPLAFPFFYSEARERNHPLFPPPLPPFFYSRAASRLEHGRRVSDFRHYCPVLPHMMGERSTTPFPPPSLFSPSLFARTAQDPVAERASPGRSFSSRDKGSVSPFSSFPFASPTGTASKRRSLFNPTFSSCRDEDY